MALLGVAGCADMSTVRPGDAGAPIARDASPEKKQRIVAERAEARWAALIRGDVDAAYAFLSPGSKAATSLAVYKSKIQPGMWRAAKADSVSCEGDLCKVSMQITYDAPRMKGVQTPLTETWLIENGVAWYVYR